MMTLDPIFHRNDLIISLVWKIRCVSVAFRITYTFIRVQDDILALKSLSDNHVCIIDYFFGHYVFLWGSDKLQIKHRNTHLVNHTRL